MGTRDTSEGNFFFLVPVVVVLDDRFFTPCELCRLTTKDTSQQRVKEALGNFVFCILDHMHDLYAYS